jgi:hypothetical protein
MTTSHLTTLLAVAALTFGITGPRVAPVEEPLSQSDIVIAADDTATEDDAESAKMGDESGVQDGAEADTSDTDTKKIDQPERDDDGTMDENGEAEL